MPRPSANDFVSVDLSRCQIVRDFEIADRALGFCRAVEAADGRIGREPSNAPRRLAPRRARRFGYRGKFKLHNDCGVSDGRVLFENGFDLFQLDAKATDIDSAVVAARPFDVAVG